VLWTAGLVNPMARELRITRYQFTRPFVLDASKTTETFGLEPTPLAEALRGPVRPGDAPASRAIE
jgi:hypothetical protein